MKAYALLFVALVSAEAFASKARVNSLLGADHLVDTQTVFTVPSHVQMLNPYMTFEFGAQGAGAEGGLMRKVGDGSLMLYLGHQNTTTIAADSDIRTGNGYLAQNNPIEAVYGFGNMGFGLSVSNVDNDSANTKETTIVGKFGMNFTKESWMWVHVHALSTAEKAAGTTTDEMQAGPYLTGGASFAMGSLRVFGAAEFGQGKQDLAAGTDQDVKTMGINVGIEDRSLKNDAADIYYGILLDYSKREYEKDEKSAFVLPAFLGIEAPVTSWAIVRASVMQNILVGNTKDETPATDVEAGIASNTLVAAGLGLKYGNFVLDGSLTAAGTGNINGSSFLSQASITYNF
jgi:hypothetical protein